MSAVVTTTPCSRWWTGASFSSPRGGRGSGYALKRIDRLQAVLRHRIPGGCKAPASFAACIPLGLVILGMSFAFAVALAQESAHPHSEAAPATADPDNQHIFWTDAARLEGPEHAVDVAFQATGRNIINPVEAAWVVDAARGDLVVAASKPIRETADAGDFLGRRGVGTLRQPMALHVTQTGRYVLEQAGRVVVQRGGDGAVTDSFQLRPGRGPFQDLTVSLAGLVYVLTAEEVRIYADPILEPPLWRIDLPASLTPAIAIAASARGEVFVAGRGRDVVAVYDIDPAGLYTQRRSLRAKDAGIGDAGGMALVPMLLLPVDTREGWFEEDRFLFLSDRAQGRIVSVETKTLAVLGSWDVRSRVEAAQPGRMDVSNRGQIAFADAVSGAAYTLPAPVVASLVENAKIRWRNVVISDSTDTSPAASEPPRESGP